MVPFKIWLYSRFSWKPEVTWKRTIRRYIWYSFYYILALELLKSVSKHGSYQFFCDSMTYCHICISASILLVVSSFESKLQALSFLHAYNRIFPPFLTLKILLGPTVYAPPNLFPTVVKVKWSVFVSPSRCWEKNRFRRLSCNFIILQRYDQKEPSNWPYKKRVTAIFLIVNQTAIFRWLVRSKVNYQRWIAVEFSAGDLNCSS